MSNMRQVVSDIQQFDMRISDPRAALKNGQFIPYFQPIVTLDTGDLTGLEILARWQHPETGLVLPSDFISHAERYDWIDNLTRHLLEKALASHPGLSASLSLSINISPVQFHNPKLAELLQDTADRAGFDLNRLIVEVTESTLIDDLTAASRIARSLKTLGCRISLDDFGTGHSGLFHLDALPFDELKIDRSFVNSLLESWESRAIVATFLELAHSRGLRVVAEGIETSEQSSMLEALGCRFGQGWLYGKPVPAEDLACADFAHHKDYRCDMLAL